MRAKALFSVIELLPSGTGWMESRTWTLILDLLGDRWTPAFHVDFAEQPFAHSLITLSSDLLSSSKPFSGWLWSHFHLCDSIYDTSLHKWSQGLLITVLWGTKQTAVAHTCSLSLLLGSGIRCVTPSTLGKWEQEVPASVSHRSWKSPGGWRNVRDDLAFSSRTGSWAWMEVNAGCKFLNSQKSLLEELCL